MEPPLLAENQVHFNARQRRIRYIGHIFNLSLQAFLLATSREALLKALAATADVSGEELNTRFSDVLESQKQSRQGQ